MSSWLKSHFFLALNTLATWREELTHWKSPWCWERLRAGGEGGNRGRGNWMASPTQWAWVWANSRRQWRTGKPGVLQSMGLQRVIHDLATKQQQYSIAWMYHSFFIHSPNNGHCGCLQSRSSFEISVFFLSQIFFALTLIFKKTYRIKVLFVWILSLGCSFRVTLRWVPDSSRPGTSPALTSVRLETQELETLGEC